MKLYNVALVARYNLNLISLEQLRKSRITYYNNPMAIMLMKNGKVIIRVKRNEKLFTFDFVQFGKVIIVVSKKPKIMAIKK